MYQAIVFSLLMMTPQSSATNVDAASSYSGTWQLHNDASTDLILDRTGDSIHIKEEHGGKLRAEYTCKVDGKECDFKEDGRKGKVSLWFNGAYLVELRTHGDAVVKRRFLVKDDRKTLQLELMPMSPPGKTETIAYTRTR